MRPGCTLGVGAVEEAGTAQTARPYHTQVFHDTEDRAHIAGPWRRTPTQARVSCGALRGSLGSSRGQNCD